MSNQKEHIDALEEFIATNRPLFEEEGPSADVWSAIKGQIRPQAKVRRLHRSWILGIAAVGLVLLGVALGTLLGKQGYEEGFNLAAASDLEELEEFYYEEVEGMVDQLVSNPDYPGIQRELAGIDTDIEQLKLELSAVPRNAKASVLQAIIASYETKVQLLENVMEYSKPFNERDEEGPTIM